MPSRIGSLIVALIAVGVAFGCAQPPQPHSPKLATWQTRTTQPTEYVADQAIGAAVQALLVRQQPNGSWETADEARPPDGGIRTALTLDALLAARENPQDSRIKKATDWLDNFQSPNVFFHALRAQTQSGWMGHLADRKRLADTKTWLLNAIRKDGTYPEVIRANAKDNDAPGAGEVLATAEAVVGMGALARMGVALPAKYWMLTMGALLDAQNKDGGWPLSVQLAGRSEQAETLAALFTIWEQYYTGDGNTYGHPSKELANAVSRGFEWLDRHFDPGAKTLAGCPMRWPVMNLRFAHQLGQASGMKYFGRHDWRAICREQTLRLGRRPDGAFEWVGPWRGPTIETAVAMETLASMRAPLVIGRLMYGSAGESDDWPLNAARLTDWLGRVYSTSYAWQQVSIDAPPEALAETPLLLVNGRKPLQFTPAQKATLKEYVLRGGLIVANATDGNAAFLASIRGLMAELFPELSFKPMTAERPLANIQFQLGSSRNRGGLAKIESLDTDVRTLVLLSGRDLSRSWNQSQIATNRGDFELAGSAMMYATGRGSAFSYQPPIVGRDAVARVTVGRLKWGVATTQWDPEPGAWSRADRRMRSTHRVAVDTKALDFAKPVRPADVPLVHLTGTRALQLTVRQRANLKRYVAAGGLLIVDAAAGRAEFAESAQAVLTEMFGPLQTNVPEFLRAAPMDPSGKVWYRGRFTLPRANRPMECRTATAGKGRVILFPFDLTAGLAGLRHVGIAGFDVPASEQVLGAILRHVLCD
ncbi:MAG: DUF4159 domain-containing protein [Phycisphaerae bacterium]|nr:DUF4159 domain-containing protein [Phycisphaerae bacterium]